MVCRYVDHPVITRHDESYVVGKLLAQCVGERVDPYELVNPLVRGGATTVTHMVQHPLVHVHE